MITNVIISLDIMSPAVFKKFNTFSQLQFKPAEQIWKYYPKTGEKNYNSKTMFNEAPIVETLLFLDYIQTMEITPVFWYNSSLFIFNDDLYSIINGEVIKVDLTNTLFMSMREAWSHPFFGILDQILKNNGGKLAKPNMQTMVNNGCLNKFFALNELYSNRVEFLGDFILPYNIKQNEMNIFIKFIKDNIGDKIVLKYDCIQEGKGVIFKDLTRDNTEVEISDILKHNKIKGKEVLITPAYEIKEEYRCYFTKHDDVSEIFSIKQRVNSTDIDVYSRENIQIYKNISASWNDAVFGSDKFKFGNSIATEILKNLSYDTGCLEFAETTDGKIIFFEVNQMAGPLPFRGVDTEKMTEFYHSIFNNLLS